MTILTKFMFIRLLDNYGEKIWMIPSYDDLEFFSDREERINKLDKELFRIQNKLRNVLESFIEVLELREKDLGDEKKQKSKKSNKK